jgi:hypothetical protein
MPRTVKEVIARTSLESGADGRCLALIDIDLCLADGSRIQIGDRLELEIDTSSAISTRAAVTSAVRTHVRRVIADGSATWAEDVAKNVRVSVDVGEPAAVAA